MANEIYTRIQLKYDSYANWTSINPPLLPGEIAIAKLVDDLAAPLDTNKNAPVLFKVGPGNFNDLPWASALAADVYNWAKLAGNNVFVKDGTGNVISGIEYDATLNEGKGGFKYTTASVATSEGLKDVQDRLVELEEQQDEFLLDTDTRYTFELKDKQLIVKSALYTNGVKGEEAEVGSYDIIDDIVIDDPDFIEDPADGTVIFQLPIVNIEWKDDENKLVVTRDSISADNVLISYGYGDGQTVKAKFEAVDSAIDQLPTFTDINNLEDRLEEQINNLPVYEGGTGIDISLAGSTAEENSQIVKVNIKFAEKLTEDNKLQILDASSNALIAEFNASEFVKDSYLKEAKYDDAANILTFTFIDNEDNLADIPVDLTDLVDIYKADESTLTATSTNNGVEFSIKDSGVTTDKIADKAVTEAKLEQNVQDALALARNSKQKQTALADKGLTGANVLASLSQNENGEIAYETRALAPADIGAQPAGNYKIIQGEKDYTGSTVKTVTEVKQDTNGVITEVKFEDIAFPEPPKGTGEVAIATIENDIVTLNGGVKLNDHTLEDDTAKADITLAKIAKTGSIYDVKEGSVEGTSEADKAIGLKYLVFNCGSATTVI